MKRTLCISERTPGDTIGALLAVIPLESFDDTAATLERWGFVSPDVLLNRWHRREPVTLHIWHQQITCPYGLIAQIPPTMSLREFGQTILPG